MTIYVDLLVALNWWIDYLLLLGVRRALGGGARPWRLVVGALVGALFCLVLLLPDLPLWADLLMKLAGAVAMVLVAFRWQGWRGLVRRSFLLFVLSAGLAGLCGLLYFFVAPQGFYVFNGVVYYAVPPLLLVVLTVVCYGILRLSEGYLRRRAPKGRLYRVSLTVGERSVIFPCLYDSGNHLVEPFTGKPVLVVEREPVSSLIAVPDIEHLPVGSGWRLVPYDTLGGGGLLPAFLPDGVAVVTRFGRVDLSDCYIAVCDSLGRGEYHGLMGSALGEMVAGGDGK